MVEQVVRNDVLAKLSLAGPTEKPTCTEVAAGDFAALMSAARELASAQNAQVEYLQYHDGESWVVVEEQQDLDCAYDLAKARSNLTESIVPSLIEGQAPQIIFSIKLAGADETPAGPGRRGKRTRGPKNKDGQKKVVDKAFIRHGRHAFQHLLKSKGVPVPELTPMEHKVIDKMEVTADFGGEPQAQAAGQRRPRRMPWHAMMKHLMTLGNDGTGSFNAEQFSTKMREYSTEIQQLWAQAQNEADFFKSEPKIRKRFVSAKLLSQHEDVLELAPGQTTTIQVQVRNDLQKAWKAGCSISLAKKQKKLPRGAAVPLEPVQVLCEEPLAGDAQATFSVPIKMGAEVAVDNEKVHEVCLSFFNGKNKAFGEFIPIKVKCVQV